jgi:hypothetical protein
MQDNEANRASAEFPGGTHRAFLASFVTRFSSSTSSGGT